MLKPVYGFATLHVPPAGEPDNAMEVPSQPLTLFAVTIGNGFSVTVLRALVPEHPFTLVTVT